MPKIKLLTSIASMEFSANYGDVIDVSIDYAARMVSTGQAEYTDPDIRNAMATPDTEKKVINKSGKK
jgi:hypothetical protein